MKKLLIISILAILSTSCGRKVLPSSNITETIKDSTTRREFVQKRDTLITIPGDTVKFSVPIFKINEKPIYRTSQSGRTTASISRTGENINVDCHTDELEKIIALQDKTIEIMREIIKEKNETITIPKKYVPGIIKTLAWIGGLTLLSIVGSLILRKRGLI